MKLRKVSHRRRKTFYEKKYATGAYSFFKLFFQSSTKLETCSLTCEGCQNDGLDRQLSAAICRKSCRFVEQNLVPGAEETRREARQRGRAGEGRVSCLIVRGANLRKSQHRVACNAGRTGGNERREPWQGKRRESRDLYGGNIKSTLLASSYK